MLDFETSNSKSEVSKSNSWKITSFLKTTSIQRELFLTMFYTINLSPLLVIKKGVMIIIFLSNYQKCPLPLNRVRFGGRNQQRFRLSWPLLIILANDPNSYYFLWIDLPIHVLSLLPSSVPKILPLVLILHKLWLLRIQQSFNY